MVNEKRARWQGTTILARRKTKLCAKEASDSGRNTMNPCTPFDDSIHYLPNVHKNLLPAIPIDGAKERETQKSVSSHDRDSETVAGLSCHPHELPSASSCCHTSAG